MDPGARNLIILFAAVWGGLFSFYGFLGARARLWSPMWFVKTTTRLQAPQAPREAPPGRGRGLYRSLRCGVCHGPDGEGGVKNPNADPDGMVLNLYDLAEGFTRNDLKDKLRKGSRPARVDEEKPAAPLEMPAWGRLLSEDDLEALSEYLFSLKSPEGAAQADVADAGEE